MQILKTLACLAVALQFASVLGQVPVGMQQPPIRVGGAVLAARLAYYVEPVYPEEARDLGWVGPIILEVTVSEVGQVDDVRLLSAHPLLGEAIVEAVFQWLYNPIQIGGKAVAVRGTLRINFPAKEEGGPIVGRPIGLLLQMDQEGTLWTNGKTRLEGKALIQRAQDVVWVGPVLIVPHPDSPPERLRQILRLLGEAGIENVVVRGRPRQDLLDRSPRCQTV